MSLLYDKKNGILGWSRIEHGYGAFRSCAVTRGNRQNDIIYFVVKDGVNYYLERLDSNDGVFLDSFEVYDEAEPGEVSGRLLWNATTGASCAAGSVPDGFINGFMDLVFRHDGRYYIVDWKSNRLGGDENSFTADGIRHEMARHGYFFQYLLYSVVLHRFLKETMGERYSWENNFGGVRYYFLRGIASGGTAPVFEDRPSEALLDRLSSALGLEG